MKKLKIAFDGPVASGKSTIAKEVARRLSYAYVDTGAMYRAVTWKALQHSANFEQEEPIIEIARRYPVEVKPDAQNRYGYKILVEGQDITDHLFEADVARYVSPVAKISQVRKILVAQQKHIAQGGGVVMAGRDITTVVMPDAEIKIYLTASEEERVKRRYRELIQKGENTEVSHVRENVQLRDTIDSSREDSPLCIADDAIVLDSSDKSIEQVVEEVLEIVNKYPGRSVTLNKS